MAKSKTTHRLSLALGALLSIFLSGAMARNPEASWDNRCEECHGEATEFARKFLWNVDGQLQGQHHIDDLDLFLQNHYLPEHEIDALRGMLLSHANSPERFGIECGACHGNLADFVEQSIWVRGESMTAMKSGQEVREFLLSHEGLQAEDIAFYLKLFARVGD